MLTVLLNILLLGLPHPPDSSWRKQYDVIIPTEGVYVVKTYYNDTINPMRIEKRWKAGVVAKNGTVIVPLEYDDIGYFSEGLAEVVMGSIVSSCWDRDDQFYPCAGKHGFIDKTGKVVIPLKYIAVGEFHEGVAWVDPDCDHSRFYIDKTGQQAFPHLYDMTLRFKGGLAQVTSRGCKECYKTGYDNYIDHTGQLLIPRRYSFIENYQPGALRAFRRGGKWGFLDTLAREVIPPTYSFVAIDRKTDWRSLRLVGQQGRYGYIRSKDGTVVIPPQYDSLFIASKGLIWAKRGAVWGALNSANRVRVPFHYQAVQPFYEHLACVKQKGKWGYVDTTGHLRVGAIYDQANYINEGLAMVQRDGKWGFIDTSGSEVIAPIYDYVSLFESGEARARWKVIYLTLDRQGNWTDWTFHTRLKQIGLGIIILGIALLAYRRFRNLSTSKLLGDHFDAGSAPNS